MSHRRWEAPACILATSIVCLREVETLAALYQRYSGQVRQSGMTMTGKQPPRAAASTNSTTFSVLWVSLGAARQKR